jgi:hypothetical protein
MGVRSCVLIGLLVLSAAASVAAEPEIVVLTYQKSAYFALRDMKYRVFYNSFEGKFIPLDHYDFLTNLRFDMMDALRDDPRARWREATPEDNLDFAALWDAKKPIIPAGLKADAILLVFFWEFGADPGNSIYLGGEMKLLSKSGKKIWKQTITQTDKVGKSLEEWIREDPAAIKTLVNALEEQAVAEAVQKIKRSKVTP